MSNEENKTETDLKVPVGLLGKKALQQRVRTERYRRLYANNFGIEFSAFDVSFIFGEILGEQDGKPVIEEIAHITISREMAKTISVLLTQNIKGYEKAFGEIQLPQIETITQLLQDEEKQLSEMNPATQAPQVKA